MSATWLDTFDRVNAAIDSVPAATYTPALAWQLLTGTATIVGNAAVSSLTANSNPLFVIPTGKRMNGFCDQAVFITTGNFYGVAAYARVVDASNWLRCRSNVVQNLYYTYTTEYEYQPRTQYWYYYVYSNTKQVQPTATQYTLQNRILQRQVRYFNGTCTNTGFTGWYNSGSPTACRASAPATPSPQFGSWCGTQTKAWRYVSAGTTGCSGGNQKFQLQANDANETPNYSFKWVNDGYSLGANESFTGSTQYVNSGGTYTSFTNSSNGGTVLLISSATVDNGTAYDIAASAATPANTRLTGATASNYQGEFGYPYQQSSTTDTTYTFTYTTFLNSGSLYWSTSPLSSNDLATGNTRQVNPVANYSYNYYLTLEKNVAGTVTQLGSLYDHGGTLSSLRLKCVGEALEVYANGTLQITATDAAHKTTGTKCGWGGGPSSYNSQAPNVTSFQATMMNPLKVKNAGGTVVEGKRRVRVGAQWVDVG